MKRGGYFQRLLCNMEKGCILILIANIVIIEVIMLKIILLIALKYNNEHSFQQLK
jgi:hypothetical protein